MALRFRYRHVHATLFGYVRSSLVALGWGNAALPAGDPANATVNFGTTPATYADYQPDEAGIGIKPNTVVVTLGNEPAAEDLELGDGLREVAIPVFVDIYGESQAIALSIASDVKNLFEDHYVTVLDMTHAPPQLTDELIELDKDDVSFHRPEQSVGSQDFKRYWRIVASTARVQYLG